jgi:AcrR family transcriptional regulator
MPRAGLDVDSVVGAAAAIADAEGLERLTLSRLADRLGIRPPSLYAHVDGLADLRRRLADRGAGELAAVLRSAVAGRAGRDALVALADAYRAYALTHPGSYAALQLAPEVAGSDAARELVEVVIAVLRGYGLDGDDAVHGVRVIRAALHGFVMLESGSGFGMRLDLDESYARLVAALDRGLVSSA